MTKRVLVCGDRHWNNKSAIRRELTKLPKDTVIIHGAASGADSIAGEIAHGLGMEVKMFPANWGKYGRAAGPIRNTQMLEEGKPNVVLAFHPDIDSSKGTKNMVGQAKKKGLPVRVFKE